MTSHVVVREYARLTSSPLQRSTLDEAQISPSAFDWLCELSSRFFVSGARVLFLEGKNWLRLDSYVGVLESPCGQIVEILPKQHEEQGDVQASRGLMRRMIERALDLPVRKTTATDLVVYEAPLSEWVMQQFLLALDHLIKRGIRFEYQTLEEEQRYLRGQLDINRQLRQPAGRGHFFQIRHAVFLPDRAENRLLKTALLQICQCTKVDSNWRLAHELAGVLHELRPSTDLGRDFGLWRTDRLMAHYQSIKPWCELILYQQMPHAVAGGWRGISFLFPMEKLFERYVEDCMRKQLLAGYELKRQVRSEYLCEQAGERMFQLRPDFSVSDLHTGREWLLDTKWKLLDAADRPNKYGLSQGDLYQMYTYGHKYLAGKGDVVLIYPQWSRFSLPLLPFQMDLQLRLLVLPFDLEKGELLMDAESSLPPFSAEAVTYKAAA